jgi:hypothetical protein
MIWASQPSWNPCRRGGQKNDSVIHGRRLNNFTKPKTPRELKDGYEEAVTLTADCHEFAKLFVAAADRIETLSKFSDIDLFTIAKIKLDGERSIDGGGESEGARSAEIRDRVLLAIVSGNPTDETFGECISAAFAGRSHDDLLVANLEAMLLRAQQRQLRALKNILIAGGCLGMICRGVLYRSIIEEQGSRLERYAAAEKFRKKLSDVPIEILSHILPPPIGEFIGPIKIIMDLVLSLAKKERALKEMRKQLIDSYEAAIDFIKTYSLAMMTWFEWANKILDHLNNLLLQAVASRLNPHLDAP